MLAALWRAPGVAPRRFGAFQRRDAPLMLAPCTNTSETPGVDPSPPHRYISYSNLAWPQSHLEIPSLTCVHVHFLHLASPILLRFSAYLFVRRVRIRPRFEGETVGNGSGINSRFYAPKGQPRGVKVPRWTSWGVAAQFDLTFFCIIPFKRVPLRFFEIFEFGADSKMID